MATDATGSPTPLGIPKFNTSADAPSGLGSNAQMDSIDALITGRIPTPAGIVTREVPMWNGSAWVRGIATTISDFASGPPGSPKDGDIWIANNIGINSELRWQFQYNAGSASAYKWEFIGGAPRSSQNTNNVVLNTLTQVGATGFYRDTNTAWFAPRAGDYAVWGSSEMDPNGNNAVVAACIFNGSSLVANSASHQTMALSTAGDNVSCSPAQVATGVAISTFFGLAMTSSSIAQTKHVQTNVFILPVRVS